MKRNKRNAIVFQVMVLVLALAAAGPLSGEAGKLIKTVVLPDITKPEMVEADARQVYISQGFSIYIYSLPDFRLKKKFGRQGEGPKEFKGYIIPYVQPGYIFVNSTNRVSYFTLDGEYRKEKQVKKVFGRFKPVGETGFVGYHYNHFNHFNHSNRRAGKRTESVYLFNTNFEKVKELVKRDHIIDKSGKINLIEERPPWFYAKDGNIFVDSPEDVIYVFDPAGNPVNKLVFPDKRVKITAEHKKRLHHFLKTNPDTRRYYEQRKNKLIFPDTFPAIRMYHVDNGKIYIQTAVEKNGKNEILVMDIKGKELGRAFFPIAPFEEQLIPIKYTVSNGKLYSLYENEEEEQWELKIYQLY